MFGMRRSHRRGKATEWDVAHSRDRETEREKETEILGSPFFLLSNLLTFLPLTKSYEHPVGKGAWNMGFGTINPLWLEVEQGKHEEGVCEQLARNTWFYMCIPSGSEGKASACNVGDLGSIPGLGRPPRGGMATHSSIPAWRIPMDRGAWLATVHGVAMSRTWLSN